MIRTHPNSDLILFMFVGIMDLCFVQESLRTNPVASTELRQLKVKILKKRLETRKALVTLVALVALANS